MPLLEDMVMGTSVIAMNCTSIPEVTQGKANYVKDPYDVRECIACMQNSVNRNNEVDI